MNTYTNHNSVHYISFVFVESFHSLQLHVLSVIYFQFTNPAHLGSGSIWLLHYQLNVIFF